MIIRSIRLSNFGLYAGVQCFEPSSSKDGNGPITLVGGLNGRGKTSLLEAVLLTLYGSRSPVVREHERSYTTYLESLIHKGTDKSEGSSVELELLLPVDGRSAVSLQIRRSWRVANKRASEKIEVWRDGREDPHLASNWNTYVEDLIPSGVSWLFFFDGEKIATLAEEEETSESLRVAIRSLLGLDLVDKLIGDLNAVIRRQRSRERKSVGADLVDSTETELDTLRKSADLLKQEIANKNNQLLRAKENLRKQEEKYLRMGGTLAESRAELERQRSELMEEHSRLRGEIIHLASGALPILMLTPLLMQVAEAVETTASVYQARAVLPLLARRDADLVTRLSEFFPDFTQLDLIARFLETDRQQVARLADKQPPIELSAVGRGQLASLLDSGYHDLRARAESLLAAYQDVEARLERVSQHLLFQFDENTVNERLEELSKAAQELATREMEKEHLLRSLHELEGQMFLAEQRRVAAYQKYHQQLDDLDAAKRTIEVALKSQETLRVFRKQVTERKIHALEEAVTNSFSSLTHKTGLVSTIRIDSESLQITLHDAANGNVSKSRLSSGEKQMLAVAILWGLAHASGRDLPVIIDTPMGRLDSSHRMNFVTKYLPNASHQVIVLSTDTEIVGPYLESLNGAVGRRYLLQYDEAQTRTTVVDGYFPEEEGAMA